MQKLQFKIQDIPEGQSSKDVHLTEEYYDLDEEIDLVLADVSVDFYRTDHFIKVSFRVSAMVELICDRSLQPFEQNLSGKYDILFQPGEVTESETAESAVRQIPGDLLIIDIEKEVRDTIMLEVPVRKIHPKYLDEEGKPVDFETKQFGDLPDKDEEVIDPRWEELKKLK